MSSLKLLEKKHFEDILGMDSGYVLDFNNDTFAEFIVETVRKDIYSDEYAFKGPSKANRLRAFWEVEEDPVVGEVLLGMLETWRYGNLLDGWEGDPLYHECVEIAKRLRGREDQEQEARFLQREIEPVSLEGLPKDTRLIPVLEYRLCEAQRCLTAGAPLAVVILCGSVLEGILLGVALEHPEEFNRANASPKDESGKVLPFKRWSLSQLVDVACQLRYLTDDVKKFGHSLRDYRNYIHPYQQMSEGSWPDEQTAKLCLQVLNVAVACLSGKRGSPGDEHAG